MCQLLGLSFNQEISPVSPFKTLVRNSSLHPDGWGVAYYIYGGRRAKLFKESSAAHDSQLASFLTKYDQFKSKTVVAHIRKASTGIVSDDNTHPFNRYINGRDFVFAHNGTLINPGRLKPLHFLPIGNTDSEAAFCYLLSCMRTSESLRFCKAEHNAYRDSDFLKIHEILREINVKAAGSFCCIFSDGNYLYCYRDLQEARNLFSMRYPKFSSNMPITKNLINKNSPIKPVTSCKGYVVATEPLISGDWQPFVGGQLMVFKNGEMVANLQ